MTDWSTLKKLIWLRIIKGGGSALRTVTGAIVHVINALARPAISVKCEVNPIQDLHGYESPWPAGGGRNLFQTTATTKTQSGVTWTINNDGSITASGTATDYTDLNAGEAIVAGLSETVTIYGDVSASENIVFGTLKLVDANNQTLETIYNGGTQTTHAVDLTQYSNAYKIVVTLKRNNNVATSGTYHIQVVKGTTVPAWSPYSNICPISGRTSATVTRTGKNLFPDAGDITAVANKSFMYNSPIIFKGQTVTLSFSDITYSGGFTSSTVFFLRLNSSGITALNFNTGTKSKTWTATEDVYGLNFYATSSGATNPGVTTVYHDAQLELGSTATAYEPYAGNTYTIQLGETVYGGTLDVTGGKMMVDRAIVDLGTLDWAGSVSTTYNCGNIPNFKFATTIPERMTGLLCSSYPFSTVASYSNQMDDQSILRGNSSALNILLRDTTSPNVVALKEKLSGVQLVYELATPIEITLTPTQIETLLGENNVWADAGDLTLTYYADGNASTSEALGILLGGTYNNPGGADDVSDDEALGILLGGS